MNKAKTIYISSRRQPIMTKGRWNKRRDLYNGSDGVEGTGDQITDASDFGNVGLIAAPKGTELIKKDETNFEVCKKLKVGRNFW